jgi:hypothetical protein
MNYAKISNNYYNLSEDSKSVDNSIVDRSVTDELARYHATKLWDADLSLRSARISGELSVNKLKIFQECERGEYASIPDQFNYVTVDLRGLQVEELKDSGGNGWKERPGDPRCEARVRFWLDGFSYKRLNELPPSLEGPSAHETGPPNIERPFVSGWLPQFAYSRDEVWKPRHHWLNLQYFDKRRPQVSEFTPGAYEQLVKTLNMDGLYDDAHKITSAKLTQERKLSRRFWYKLRWWSFGFFFGYGFSPFRAFCTITLCIIVGACAAHVADYGVAQFPTMGNVLVANRTVSEGTAIDDGITSANPCGKRIQSVLYALDVFVPVLNLRQQTACSIRTDKPGWRHAQAAYALLGWLLTPLALLTFSGILKKHLEK